MKINWLRRLGLVTVLASSSSAFAAGSFDASTEDNFRAGWIDFAMYVPNRLIDLSDVVTLGFSAGAATKAGVEVTQFCQFGADTGTSYVAGSAYARQYGTGVLTAGQYGAGCFYYNTSYFDWIAGTMRNYVFDVDSFRLVSASEVPYREKNVDLWAIGAKAGVVLGVDVAFHPISLADFVTGLVGYDLEGDDL